VLTKWGRVKERGYDPEVTFSISPVGEPGAEASADEFWDGEYWAWFRSEGPLGWPGTRTVPRDMKPGYYTLRWSVSLTPDTQEKGTQMVFRVK
jgi:hypothetical protein